MASEGTSRSEREPRSCPLCQAVLNVRGVGAGKRVRCPKCREVLKLSTDRMQLLDLRDASSSGGLSTVQDVGEVSVRPPDRWPTVANDRPVASCPACASEVSLPPSSPGRLIRCPGCDGWLRIGADGSSVSPARRRRQGSSTMPSASGESVVPDRREAEREEIKTSVFLRPDLLAKDDDLDDFLDALKGTKKTDADDLDSRISNIMGHRRALDSVDIESIKVTRSISMDLIGVKKRKKDATQGDREAPPARTGTRPVAPPRGKVELPAEPSDDQFEGETWDEPSARAAAAAAAAAADQDPEEWLVRRLVEKGILNEEQVDRCRKARDLLKAEKKIELPVYHYAVKFGYVSAQGLTEAIQELKAGSNSATLSENEWKERLAAIQMEGGTRLGPFRILDELGRGAVGVVYRVEDTRSGQIRAMKFLVAGGSVDERARRRFDREVEAIRVLDHPAVVKVFDVGEHEGHPYYTMEYVQGETLDAMMAAGIDRMRHRARSQLEPVVSILAQVVEGAGYAHAQSIVHRDIKPSNILVDPSGRAKLTDFGLAKKVDSGTYLTRTGDVVGTPHYMAPEQTQGETGLIGPHTDTYAFGVLLYRILTGKLPFDGDSSMELFHAICEREPVPPRRIVGSVPPDLERICLKALSKEPRNRYADGEEMAEDLRRWLLGEKVLARPKGTMYRLWRRAMRRKVASFTILGLFVALIATVAFLVLGPERGSGLDPATECPALVRRAGEEALAGKHASALALCDQAIELDPDFGPAYVAKARIVLDRSADEWPDAVAILDTLLARPGAKAHHAQAHRTKGDVYRAKERWELSLNAYSAAIELEPRDREAYLGRSEVYYRMGLIELGNKDKRRADELGHEEVQKKIDESSQLYREGKYDAALRTLEQAFEIEPKSPAALLLAGRIHVRAGRLHRALAAFTSGLDAAVDERAALLAARAGVLLDLGDSEAARADAERAVDLDGEDPWARFVFGRVLLVTGQIRWALEELDRAEKRLGDEADLYLCRAAAERVAGRVDDALADLEVAIRLDPGNAEALFLRGRILGESNLDLARAEASLRAALEAGAKDPALVRLELARVVADAGRREAALEDLERVLAERPSWAEPYLLRSSIHRALGRLEAAARDADAAIGRAPYRAGVYEERGWVRLATKDVAGARDDFERALVIDPHELTPLIGRLKCAIERVELRTIIEMGEEELPRYLERGWDRPPDLFAPAPDEVVRAAFGDRSEGGAAEVDTEEYLEECIWAAQAEEEFVRAAGLRGLVACGERARRRVQELRAGATAGPARSRLDAALEALDAHERQSSRRALLSEIVQATLGADPGIPARWRSQAPEVSGSLVELLKDATAPVWMRRVAARSLVLMRHPVAWRTLEEQIQSSSDPAVRLLATVEMMGGGQLLNPELLVPFAKAEEPWMRGLALLHGPPTHHLLAAAGTLLEDPDRRVALHAAYFLARHRDERGVAPLLAAAGDPMESYRLFAVRGLGHLTDQRVGPALLRSLSDPDPAVRRGAAIWVRLRREKDAGARLREMLVHDPVLGLRVQAGISLAALDDVEASLLLEAIILDSRSNLLMRAVAANYFYKTRRYRFNPQWLQILQGGTEDVEGLVLSIFAFSFVGGQFAKPILFKHLEHEAWLVRAAVCSGLVFAGGSDTVEKLFGTLADPEPLVGAAAAGSLVYQKFRNGLDVPDLEGRLAKCSDKIRHAAASVCQRLATDGFQLVHPNFAGPGREIEIRQAILGVAIGWDPENADLYADLARIHAAAGRLPEALRAYEDAIRRDAGRNVYHRELAAVHERLGQTDRAIAHLESALQLEPADCQARTALARRLLAAGRGSEAATHALWAICLDPSLPEVHALEADVILKVKNAQHSAEYMHLVLTWHDAHGYLQFETSRHVARKGDAIDHVLEHLQKAKNAGFDTTAGRDLPEFARYLGDEAVRRMLQGP